MCIRLTLSGFAIFAVSMGASAADYAELLASDNDAVAQVCEAGAASVEEGTAAIIQTVKDKPALLRPVMECIYWKVDPKDFNAMVNASVESLNADGG